MHALLSAVTALLVAACGADDSQGPRSENTAGVAAGTAGTAGFGALDGGGVPTPVDASSGSTLDAASALDAAAEGGMFTVGPQPYVADAVTLGRDLPARLPVLRVTVGQVVERDVEIPGTLEIFETHDGTHSDLDALAPTLSTPIAFQGRGNFTWGLAKKGYAFELQDTAGNGKDLTILGLPPGSDFALYACYTDKTCLRNALVYALGQELGRWSPRARFVELFLDGQYQGLYMLWERIRRDAHRVNIPKPALDATAGDLAGGYIVRLEAGKDDERDFTVPSGRIYTYHYPKVLDLTQSQRDYLTGMLGEFEANMAAQPQDYASWIDVQSWVDRAILEELTNNWDGYVHSIYMVKHAAADGGLLAMGPLWDFDLAFGNGNANGVGYNCKTDTWAYQNVRDAPDDVPPYWLALFAQPSFQTAWKCRYQSLRVGPLALATFHERIDAWVAFTAEARVRDQAKWNTLGKLIFPNCSFGLDYAAEVQLLRDFIEARLTWLDQQAAAMPGTCP